jgi:hypothetical protein
MVVFLDPRRPQLLANAFLARQHLLEKCKALDAEVPADLLEFVSHALVCEASGQRLGTAPVADRQAMGMILQAFAGKYRNPVVVRAIAALIASSIPR